MKELIAVCGQSGVGKRTLVTRLLKVDTDARRRFGISTDATIRAFGADFDCFGQEHRDADFAIWKWQYDTDHRIDELAREYPQVKHRAILIWLPHEQHHARMLRSKKQRHADEAKGRAAISLAESFVGRCVPAFRDNAIRKDLGVHVELVNGATEGYDMINWSDLARIDPAYSELLHAS